MGNAAKDKVEDSYEDLCDIEANFPINDNWERRSTTADGQSLATKELSRNANSHSEGDVIVDGALAASKNSVDEDATMRCFNLSVNAHIGNRGRVATFEPILPINNDTSANERQVHEEGKPSNNHNHETT